MSTAREETSAIVRRKTTEYLASQLQPEKYPDENVSQILTKEDINPLFVRRWTAYLRNAAQVDDPIFRPWRQFASLASADFRERAKDVIDGLGETSNKPVNQAVAQAFSSGPTSLHEVAKRYGQLFAEVEQQWREVLAHNAAAKRLPDANKEALRQVLFGPQSPSSVPDEAIVGNEWYFDITNTEKLWQLQGEVDRWLIRSPKRPLTRSHSSIAKVLQEPRALFAAIRR